MQFKQRANYYQLQSVAYYKTFYICSEVISQSEHDVNYPLLDVLNTNQYKLVKHKSYGDAAPDVA